MYLVSAKITTSYQPTPVPPPEEPPEEPPFSD
jgi:hypothetical protein